MGEILKTGFLTRATIFKHKLNIFKHQADCTSHWRNYHNIVALKSTPRGMSGIPVAVRTTYRPLDTVASVCPSSTRILQNTWPSGDLQVRKWILQVQFFRVRGHLGTDIGPCLKQNKFYSGSIYYWKSEVKIFYILSYFILIN